MCILYILQFLARLCRQVQVYRSWSMFTSLSMNARIQSKIQNNIEENGAKKFTKYKIFGAFFIFLKSTFLKVPYTDIFHSYIFGN